MVAVEYPFAFSHDLTSSLENDLVKFSINKSLDGPKLEPTRLERK